MPRKLRLADALAFEYEPANGGQGVSEIGQPYLKTRYEVVSRATLVDGLAIDDPRTSFQGVSLLPATFDGVTPDRGVYATTRPLSPSGRRGLALHRGQKKIILEEVGAPHLYDLSLDPLEQEDRARDEPVRIQLLLQELLAQQRCNQVLLTGVGQAPQIELDAERLKELKALGYIQ